MENKDIEHLFEGLSGSFDIETPRVGHQSRFLDKLAEAKVETVEKTRFNWKPFLAIAASVVICFSVFMGLQSQNNLNDLASVSPELSKTQDFFYSNY